MDKCSKTDIFKIANELDDRITADLQAMIRKDIKDLEGTEDRMVIVTSAYVNSMALLIGTLIGAAPDSVFDSLTELLNEAVNVGVHRAKKQKQKLDSADDEVRALLKKIAESL